MSAVACTGEIAPKPLLAFNEGGIAHVIEADSPVDRFAMRSVENTECLGRSSHRIVKSLLKSGMRPGPVWDLGLAAKMISKEAPSLGDEIRSFQCLRDPSETLKSLNSMRIEAKQHLESSHQVDVFEKIELPLIPILAEMEIEGIRCDKEKLLEADGAITRCLNLLTSEIHSKAGHAFNLDNTHVVGTVLYERLKLSSCAPRTRTGLYATDEATLCALPDHPIVVDILQYRRLATLKRSYLKVLPQAIHPDTGRLHTTFEQLEAANGRLISKNPNLQNIPISSKEGREIRRAFIPRDEDFLILSADYSQLELRVLAHFSQDETLLSTFEVGDDVHAATASRVFGIGVDEVTDWMRAEAKAINYGIAYGMSAFGLAKRTGRSIKESKTTIDNYFERMPRIQEYSDRIVRQARKQGFVRTICGRRRYIPEVNDWNLSIRRRSERVAVCSPIQGTAADLIKLAMISIHGAIRERNLKTRMLLQVHDELVFDLYRPEQAEVVELVTEKMETALKLSVPLAVNIGCGSNWLELN